jgi:hypothetical protein
MPDLLIMYLQRPSSSSKKSKGGAKKGPAKRV